MLKVWESIDTHLMRKPPLSAERLPTFYPSSAGCSSLVNGEPIGACLRMNYFRCAGYEKSDHDTVWSQYVFAGGHLWEQWICDKLKEAGLWVGNSLKFVDKVRYISGEVDIIIEDPEDGGLIIVEVKTFFGYEGKKRICGNTTIKPSPKDPHLLQSMIYKDQFKGQIKGTMLLYFARDDHSRQEFLIESEIINNQTCPKITTNYKGIQHSYVDERVSIEGIYDKYELLMKHLVDKEIPSPDYEHVYSMEKMDRMFEDGTMAKTNYAKYQSNPEKHSQGYHMCTKYCSYRSMCKEMKKESGDR